MPTTPIFLQNGREGERERARKREIGNNLWHLMCLAGDGDGSILNEKIFIFCFDNEVDFTEGSSPVVLKNSCSKLDCQNGFNLIFFSYMIASKVQ